MDLYILRHGIAVEQGTPGIRSDFDRPLTPEGVKKVRQIARALRALELSFDGVLSSPYLRARQTAECFVKELGASAGPVELLEELRADAPTLRPLIRALKKRSQTSESLVLVGHEPNLSMFASLLITGIDRSCLALKKGGFCKLTVRSIRAGRCATLEWLTTPRLLLKSS